MKSTSQKNSRDAFTAFIDRAKTISKTALEEASETDFIDSFPVNTLEEIKDADLLIACSPAKFGGLDLGLITGSNLSLLKLLKHIGSGNLVMGRVVEGHINAQLLINEFGTTDQNKTFAEDAKKGKLFGVWNTQANDGTTITIQKDGTYLLNGSKTFATGSDYVSRPMITAMMDDGSWQMCVVPMDEIKSETDNKWWNPMGMKSSRSYKVTFTDVSINKKDLIGKPGSYYKQPYFGGGAIRFAAVQLGAAERLLTETVKYLQDLNRTDDPFQKTRIGQMSIAVTSGNQWLKGAAEKLDLYMNEPSTGNSELFLSFANMMRTAIEEICTVVIALCQKCVGARGLNKPYHFERIIRDLNTYLRQPAPDAILADVGRYVLHNENFTKNLWENNGQL